MSGASVRDLETFNCPLIGKEICLGDCYDIQMIRMRCIKIEASLYPFDRKKADELCDECPYNQLLG